MAGNPSQQHTPSADDTSMASGPSVWLNKQRVKLNCKLLGHQPATMKEDRPTYREQFIPPEMSMLVYLLSKVSAVCSEFDDFPDGYSLVCTVLFILFFLVCLCLKDTLVDLT